MKTIFLIDGAAGTGKSDMVNYLTTKKRNHATLIPKFTTRKQRRTEKNTKLDLNFPEDSKDQFLERTKDEDFYWYTYGNKELGEEYYGFYKENISEALKHFAFVLIIVRDHETILEIKRDYNYVQVISVFIYTDKDLIVERLKKDKCTPKEIDDRQDRQPLAWYDYLKHSSSYDELIINSSKKEEYELLLEALFNKYSKSQIDMLSITPKETFQIVTPLIGYKNNIQEKLERYPFHKNVFLMMKFRDDNKRVYQYIKKTLAAHNYNCVRADEPFWDITRNAYNPVAILYCCKFGIALFDQPEQGNDYSPNVAYELGMMQNQKKECLILKSATIKGVPFDLVKELYVTYSDNLELEEVLENWITKLSD